MPSVDVRDATGATTGTIQLDDALFGVQPNVPVLHQVVTAQLAAARRGTQSTKTRAEVSGGGAKPYRQKGTGRARQGSTRAPHWSGGGVALGPKPRSYRQRTPKKMIRLALASALSDRAADGKIVVLDAWGFDGPSTKAAVTALAALGLEGRILVVVPGDDEVVIKSFRNLPDVQLLVRTELNAYDVLCNDWIVFPRDLLPGASVQTDAPASPPSDAPAAAPADAPAEVTATEPVAVTEPADAAAAEPVVVTEPADAPAEPVAVAEPVDAPAEPVAVAEPVDAPAEPVAEPVAAEPVAVASTVETPAAEPAAEPVEDGTE
jgi:large subunit ribosomal protein L4